MFTLLDVLMIEEKLGIGLTATFAKAPRERSRAPPRRGRQEAHGWAVEPAQQPQPRQWAPADDPG